MDDEAHGDSGQEIIKRGRGKGAENGVSELGGDDEEGDDEDVDVESDNEHEGADGCLCDAIGKEGVRLMRRDRKQRVEVLAEEREAQPHRQQADAGPKERPHKHQKLDGDGCNGHSGARIRQGCICEQKPVLQLRCRRVHGRKDGSDEPSESDLGVGVFWAGQRVCNEDGSEGCDGRKPAVDDEDNGQEGQRKASQYARGQQKWADDGEGLLNLRLLPPGGHSKGADSSALPKAFVREGEAPLVQLIGGGQKEASPS